MVKKCAVFAVNSNGEPDIFFCKVRATEEEVENGDHYDRARALAVDEGYEPCMVAEENDPAGAVLQLCCWESFPDPE